MSLELLSLSPASPVAQVDSKRLKTPSSEAESPQKYLLISPKGAVPVEQTLELKGLPSVVGLGSSSPPGYVNVDNRISLPHAHPDPEQNPVEEQHPRHVVLPFDLRKDPASYTAQNRKLIYELFPEIHTIGFDQRFIRLLMNKLPPQPWPQTIAGVPAFFTTDLAEEGPVPPMKRFGSYRIRLHTELDYRQDSAKQHQLFDIIKQYFSDVGINITEIQYWGSLVVIILENDDSDMKVVPRFVASCPCFYLFEREMARPKDFAALRIKEPDIDTFDDSEYTALRPGIMLSSGKDEISGNEYRTTSGVLVKDKHGNQYVTVASHGFPHGPRVFHPKGSGREVGEIAMEITYTDVALLKLHDRETYNNELFESSHMLNPPPSLKEFISATKVKLSDPVFMDSAFTGYGEGFAYVDSHTRVRRIPADDNLEPEMEWISTRWDYMGQGSAHKYVDGACGSVIWNEDGNVLGFFRYAPASGHFLDWCQSVSASQLIDQGYTVV